MKTEIKITYNLSPELEDYISKFVNRDQGIVFSIDSKDYELIECDGYYKLIVNGSILPDCPISIEEIFNLIKESFGYENN